MEQKSSQGVDKCQGGVDNLFKQLYVGAEWKHGGFGRGHRRLLCGHSPFSFCVLRDGDGRK